MRKTDADVIVVGAGAAGLAAAGACEARGLKVLVLEARERIGGRVLTEKIRGRRHPVELGAEFIHGEPEHTLAIARAAGLTYYDCLDLHHVHLEPSPAARTGPSARGRSRPDPLREAKGYFERIDGVMHQLIKGGRRDRSFAEFARDRRLKGEIRDLAFAFVEGFNAGPKDILSEQGLARSNSDEGDESQTHIRRFAGAYEDVITHLAGQLRTPDRSIRLGHVVTRIEWQHVDRADGGRRGPRGDVRVQTSCGRDMSSYRARFAIVTLPIGVLQAAPGEMGAIDFAPDLPGLSRALGGVGMGHAVRLVMYFRSPVWLNKKRQKVGFLHGSHASAFQTWWTLMPVHDSVITAWAGGPAAERLAGKSRAELTEMALQNLAGLLALPVPHLTRELQSVHHHDWTTDPFARGAYSYIRVGGLKNSNRLARSFGGVLFFAGEGTNAGASRGTVEGAIETGLRAARQLTKLIK